MRRVSSRRIAILAAVCAVALSVTACSSSGNGAANKATTGATGTPAASTAHISVVYAQYGSSIAFSQEVTDSLVKAAKASGIELTVFDNGNDPAKTIANAQLAVNRKPDLFIEYSPLTDNQRISTMMKSAGIPVLAVQVAIPGAPLFSIDNTQVGGAGGQGLVQAAAAKWVSTPPVAALILSNVAAGGSIDKDRAAGATAAIKKRYPNIAVTVGDDKADVSTTLQVVNAFMTAHPSGKLIIWSHLDQYSVAAANAAKAAGRADDVLIGSTGGDASTIPFIKSGIIAGTVDLNPQTWGDQITPLAQKIATKQSVPAITRPTGVVFVNADNLSQHQSSMGG